MAIVLTNLPKPGEEQRYVDVINGSGGKQRLCVDASLSGTVTVGDIVITDPITALDARVITGQHGLDGLVVVCEEIPRSKVTVFGTAIVAPSGTLNLVTFTVPALKKFFWKGAIIGGGQEGEFKFKIGAAQIALVRNSGANRTIVMNFPEEPEASAGSTIDIDVTNIGDLSKSFEATLFGYNVDA